MKSFSILTQILTVALIASACGTEALASPTFSAVDLQNTAAVVALTAIAATQAAMPTATLPPPTETPSNTPPPTNTFLPLPSSQATSAPPPSGSSAGGDACLTTILPGGLPGMGIKIRINNSTKVTLTLSVNLQPTVPAGVCGYRAYTLEPQQSIVINDLVEGCYSLWAWNPDPKHYFMVTNGTHCLDIAHPWAFDISTKDIRLKGDF